MASKGTEISLKHIPPEIGLASVHLQVKRSGIRHHYSRIPLHIMVRFARESGIDVRGNLHRQFLKVASWEYEN